MKIQCAFDNEGNLINIGEWDPRPFTDDDGQIYDSNPFPEGAYWEEREIVVTAEGGRYLKQD
jgi:hypothetical protein